MTDTPTTAAGRALLAGILKFAPDEDPTIKQVRAAVAVDILAIEREAAAAAIARVRAALLGPNAPVDALYERHTRAILDAEAQK